MKCFGFAPLIRRVNEHFVWHPLLQLYIAIMCGKWPGVWFQACKWALYVFVHSTHLLFVFKMTEFTDQFISTVIVFMLFWLCTGTTGFTIGLLSSYIQVFQITKLPLYSFLIEGELSSHTVQPLNCIDKIFSSATTQTLCLQPCSLCHNAPISWSRCNSISSYLLAFRSKLEDSLANSWYLFQQWSFLLFEILPVLYFAYFAKTIQIETATYPRWNSSVAWASSLPWKWFNIFRRIVH